MPLSLVIEYPSQVLFPALVLGLVIKPVFCQHRQNIKFHNRMHPICRTLALFTTAEIAMADTETSAKRAVLCNFLV